MRILILFLLSARIVFGQTPDNDPHWELLWKDNFDSLNYLNTNYWNVKNNFDHYGEIGVYTNRTQNVFVNNGKLSIRLSHENYSCPVPSLNFWGCKRQNDTGSPYNFTSGWVETQIPYEIHFGFIEAQIKLPYINGIWPAFWTVHGVTPINYQEIDIFEMIPGAEERCGRDQNEYILHTNNIMGSNIHANDILNICNDPNASPVVSQIQDYTQWHTYAIEWSPSRIIWYIDNQPVCYYNNDFIQAPTTLIFSMGLQTEAGNALVAVPELPVIMEVGSVKVYKLNKDCDDYIDASSYDFTLYDNVEKNFIEVGSNGGSNSLSYGDDVKLRASEYIEFSGDFEVPIGAKLYADADNSCLTSIDNTCTQIFNPCHFDIAQFDNSKKRIIELGGSECNITIVPLGTNVSLLATDFIHLKTGVTITPSPSLPIELRTVLCE